MDVIGPLTQPVLVGLLLLITISAVRGWFITRMTARAYLAVAMGCFAVLTVLTDDIEARGWVQERVLLIAQAAAFFGVSGAILLVRHSIAPVSRRVLRAAGGVPLFVISVLAVVGFPSDPQRVMSAFFVVIFAAGVIVWLGMLVEPILFFWRTARLKPKIQARRLRSLCLAFLLFGLLLIFGAIDPRSMLGDPAPGVLLLEIPALLALLVSVAPPRWLRVVWRSAEERILIQEAPLFAQLRPHEIAPRTLDWAIRMVGGEGGYIRSSLGVVLASSGLTDETIEAMHAQIGDVHAPRAIALEVPWRQQVAIIPLHFEASDAFMVISLGPFSPPVVVDDLSLLKHHGDAMAFALDRAELELLKSNFVTSVSHELRTPMTVLRGIAMTLSRSDVDRVPEAERQHLRLRLAEAGKRVERILDDVFDLERLDAGFTGLVRSVTDVGALARAAVAAADLDLARVSMVFDPRLAVAVDPIKVRRIFDHLISNALVHVGPDVRLWIAGDVNEQGVRITVADDGPGIPADERSRVFQAFRKTHRSGSTSGAGIGLALVQNFARMHGGSVTMSNRFGGGTTVTVFLPGEVTEVARQLGSG